MKAEMLWVLKCVAGNYSANSCDGSVEVFKLMFPDSSIPKLMTLGRTKHMYVIVHALGPYFYNHLIDDMDGSYFSLQFDETTNAKDVKEFQILVNFWSKALNRPSVCHLETVFIGQATAKIITDHIVSAIDKSAFSLSGLIMIGSDRPNVNKSIFTRMNGESLY